jgi:hypothetical protein
VLALVQNDEPSTLCHRHLARGERVVAIHTKVWIELDVLVTTPDLCQGCMDDLDSWLRCSGFGSLPTTVLRTSDRTEREE